MCLPEQHSYGITAMEDSQGIRHPALRCDDLGVTDGWGILEACGTAGGFSVAAVVYAESYRNKLRSQAELICVWVEHDADESWMHVRNSGLQAVYNVRLWDSTVPSTAIVISVLPPGADYVSKYDGYPSVLKDPFDYAFFVSFHDAAGRLWVRGVNGGLKRPLSGYFRLPWRRRSASMSREKAPRPVRRAWERLDREFSKPPREPRAPLRAPLWGVIEVNRGPGILELGGWLRSVFVGAGSRGSCTRTHFWRRV
jgi:hypothetical protein